MNAPTKNAPGGAATPSEGQPIPHHQVQKGPSSMTQTGCRYCTVPTTEGDVCTFCSTYTPPADDALADAASHTAAAIAAAADALEQLPADAPLFGAVDIVSALAHLRTASSRLDRVGRALAAQQPAGGTR